jgi:O-antigen/teichoic acid export membrane protein
LYSATFILGGEQEFWMSLARKIVGGALGGVGYTGICMAVSFLQMRVLLHSLPVALSGIWLILANLGVYTTYLDIGLTQTLGREISFAVGDPNHSDADRDQRIGTLVRSCTAAVATVGIVAILVGAPIGWAYMHSITPSSEWRQTRVAWMLYILASSLNVVAQGWYAGIYGLGHVLYEKAIRSGSVLMGFVLFIAALHMHLGVEGLAGAYLLQVVIGAMAARVALGHCSGGATRHGKVEFNIIKSLIGPSLRFAFTQLGMVLVLQTDNVVIASTLGPELVPDYQAVSKLIFALLTLSMVLVSTSTPLISQAFARGDRSTIVQVMNRNLRFTLGLLGMLGIYLAFFADRVIALWLGPGHFIGFPVVYVLVAMMGLEVHQQSMGTVTQSTGKVAFAASTVFAGVLNIIISIVLAKHLGVLGVVLGTLIAQLVTNDWYVPYYTLRHFQEKVSEHLRSVVAPMLAFGLAMLAVGYAARRLTMGLPNVVACSMGLASTVGIGAAIFVSIALTGDERMTLQARIRRLRFRWATDPPIDLVQ